MTQDPDTDLNRVRSSSFRHLLITALACFASLLLLFGIVVIDHVFGPFFVPCKSRLGCTFEDQCALTVSPVWTAHFPKLLTESAIRMLDANADGVEDVVMGFATGQCVQSDGVDLSSRHFV